MGERIDILNESELTDLEHSSGDDCDMAAVKCVVRELRERRAADLSDVRGSDEGSPRGNRQAPLASGRWAVKGLLEIQRDNDAAVARAESKRTASLRRLKQRIANLTHSPHLGTSRRDMRRQINATIDAWAAAEEKRGGR
jgi:hypothetical protein